MKLVLDTSALLYIVEQKIDLAQLASFKIYVPTAVLRELQLLKQRNKKARVALELLPLMKTEFIETGEEADVAVLNAARELNAVLVTGDSELIERARKLGIAVALFHKKQLLL